MSTKLEYPEFASEAEEADWLYEHSEELDRYFTPATETLREMLLREHDLILPESHIPVPMSGEDIAELKAIASAEGMNAAEYLGKVVHEFLQAKRAA